MNVDSGGIINLYKPVGITSFSAVSRVRKRTGFQKAGHCGTLDPFAEGVLPICLGRATAAVQFMDHYDKKYRVGVVFGKETDTQDRTGKVTCENPPTRQALDVLEAADFAPLREAVRCLTGTFEQLPPMYSAVKVDGRPLYEYARKGREVERRPRTVTVYSAELVEASAREELRAVIDIHCSKGTYIRTLCEDLGRTLSYGAYADSLIRTACGPFTLERCVSLEQLQELFAGTPPETDSRFDSREEAGAYARSRLSNLLRLSGAWFQTEEALADMRRIFFSQEQIRKIIQGQIVSTEGRWPLDEPLAAFYGADRFVGVVKGCEYEEETTLIHAERIFGDATDFQ